MSRPALTLAFAVFATWASPLGAGQAAPHAADASERLGVMTHFAHGWPLELIPRLADDGLRQVRDEVYWEEVESAPGRFEFPKKYDVYLSGLDARGIRLLLPLTFGNRHHDGGLTPHTEAGYRAYARYAAETVRRYGDQLSAVEIWNEYNGGFVEGPATEDRVYHYTRLLRHAYAAVKSERPDLVVLGGATAGLPFPYLEALARAGALDHLDAVSVHPYRDGENPESLETDIRRLQALLHRYRPDRNTPIWVTELGWPARPPGILTGGSLDESEQASHLVRSLALLLSLGVEKVYWYQYLEYGADAGLGLLRAAPGHPGKPAHTALRALLARLRGVTALVREPAPDGVYVLRLETSPGSHSGRSASSRVLATRLVWSLRPTVIPIAGTNTLARLDGSEEPAPAWIILDDRPVYLVDAAASLFPSSSEASPAAALADSSLDFALEQDRGGWSYGSFVPDRDDPGRERFVAAERSRVTDWREEWYRPGSPWSVSALEQHPAVEQGQSVPAVRRWTSQHGGALRVLARVRAGPAGDGVRIRILVGDKVRFSERLGGGLRGELELDFVCDFTPGLSLDIAIDAGPSGDPDHDATRVALSLHPSP